jgi:hypothetical protein
MLNVEQLVLQGIVTLRFKIFPSYVLSVTILLNEYENVAWLLQNAVNILK